MSRELRPVLKCPTCHYHTVVCVVEDGASHYECACGWSGLHHTAAENDRLRALLDEVSALRRLDEQ